MIEFGQKTEGVNYLERPGSYGVAIKDGKILVEITPKGWFLPGGGMNENETPEDAVAREFMEETGFEVIKSTKIGRIPQYVKMKGADINKFGSEYIVKICNFFNVELGNQVSPTLPDGDTNEARWVPVDEALQNIHHESYKWAIRQVVK